MIFITRPRFGGVALFLLRVIVMHYAVHGGA